MKTQDIARESVASLLHTNATPKAAIQALSVDEFSEAPGVSTALADLKALPWNAKTKALPILEDLLAKLDESEEGGPLAVARIPEIEQEILHRMEVSSKALVEVGDLLNEAREEFDSAVAFLAWASEKFGFRKAYAYRLMGVAKQFPVGDPLRSQSVNVLHKVAAMPEEVKKEAREKVEEGEELTGEAVKRMAQPDEESTVVDEAPTLAPRKLPEEEASDIGAPWNPDTGKEVNLGAAPVAVPPASTPESETIRQLQATISELQAELAASRHERESKAAGKSKAPMLPQFSSTCWYARLGLSAEQGQDANEVRKAFRALVKAGYNSQHEAYTALVEAKDGLMQVAEAA